MAFVAGGLGVALMPAGVRYVQIRGAVYRPLTGTTAQVALALAHRAGDDSEVLARVLACIWTLVGDGLESVNPRRQVRVER